jgi:hypothetical protein
MKTIQRLRKNLQIFVIIFLVPYSCQANFIENLLTLGYPGNIENVEFGNVSYGVNSPVMDGVITGQHFRICDILQEGEETVVFGIHQRQKHKMFEVWRANTRDSRVFTENKTLFQVPDEDPHWLWAELAVKPPDQILLMQCQIGSPKVSGHFFHVFGGTTNGENWRKLLPDPVYYGQDAWSIVWNEQLKKFVNYQTSYQPWDKRYADNMRKARRVLHIRTSPDGKTWTPSESFGSLGPYLPPEQLVIPDKHDPPDTEFYRFSVMNLGEFWMGAMVKYISQPRAAPKFGSWPHGPFFGYEWWVSHDGLNWNRPYRDDTSLDATPWNFAYYLCQPMTDGDNLVWIINSSRFILNRKRICYVYNRANAEIITRPFRSSGKQMMLEVDFGAMLREVAPSSQQGYIMAELTDQRGEVIEGFESSKCLFEVSEQTSLPLKWGTQILPDKINDVPLRLRLYFRDARIYSLTH